MHGYCPVTDQDGDNTSVVWLCKGQPYGDGEFQWRGGTEKSVGLKGQMSCSGISMAPTASECSVLKGGWELL